MLRIKRKIALKDLFIDGVGHKRIAVFKIHKIPHNILDLFIQKKTVLKL